MAKIFVSAIRIYEVFWDGKRTICYESISDILISMFSGINKCSQGRNIFVIDFGLSRYQKFVISLICVSAEFPTYNDVKKDQFTGKPKCASPALRFTSPALRFTSSVQESVNQDEFVKHLFDEKIPISL